MYYFVRIFNVITDSAVRVAVFACAIEFYAKGFNKIAEKVVFIFKMLVEGCSSYIRVFAYLVYRDILEFLFAK